VAPALGPIGESPSAVTHCDDYENRLLREQARANVTLPQSLRHNDFSQSTFTLRTENLCGTGVMSV